MKIRNLIGLFFVAAVMLSSCDPSPMIGPDPSFRTSLGSGKEQTAYVDEPFWVFSTRGLSEYRTVYSGQDRQVFGDPASTGADFGAADSMSVVYKSAGQFTLVMVASSTGGFGNEFKTREDSIFVTVLDRRTEFRTFQLHGVKGEEIAGAMKGNKIIGEVVYIKGISDYTAFKPAFTTTSDNAKVYLGSVAEANLQQSTKTVVDFTPVDSTSNPLTYIVVSPEGSQQSYEVFMKRVDPSKEAELQWIQSTTSGTVVDNAKAFDGAVDFVVFSGKLNGGQLRYNLSYLTSPFATIEVFYKSSASGVPKWQSINQGQYNLLWISAFRVTAQDRMTVNEFPFNVYMDFLKSFSMVSTGSGVLNPLLPGNIDMATSTITFNVPKDGFGGKLNTVKFKWESSATKVEVDGVPQESNVTVQNFGNITAGSVTKTYNFYAGKRPIPFNVTINLQ